MSAAVTNRSNTGHALQRCSCIAVSASCVRQGRPPGTRPVELRVAWRQKCMTNGRVGQAELACWWKQSTHLLAGGQSHEQHRNSLIRSGVVGVFERVVASIINVASSERRAHAGVFMSARPMTTSFIISSLRHLCIHILKQTLQRRRNRSGVCCSNNCTDSCELRYERKLLRSFWYLIAVKCCAPTVFVIPCRKKWP